MFTHVFHAELHLGTPDFLEVKFVRVAAAQDRTKIGKFYRGVVRDPRPYGEDDHLLLRVKLRVLSGFGPGADQAHFPHDHVQKLGKFVDFELPYKSTDTRNAGIIVT